MRAVEQKVGQDRDGREMIVLESVYLPGSLVVRWDKPAAISRILQAIPYCSERDPRPEPMACPQLLPVNGRDAIVQRIVLLQPWVPMRGVLVQKVESLIELIGKMKRKVPERGHGEHVSIPTLVTFPAQPRANTRERGVNGLCRPLCCGGVCCSLWGVPSPPEVEISRCPACANMRGHAAVDVCAPTAGVDIWHHPGGSGGRRWGWRRVGPANEGWVIAAIRSRIVGDLLAWWMPPLLVLAAIALAASHPLGPCNRLVAGEGVRLADGASVVGAVFRTPVRRVA